MERTYNDIIHKDEYSWGTVYYIISNGGHGVVRIQHNNDRLSDATILGLSVTEEYRKNGIGEHLIKSAEKLIRTIPNVTTIEIAAEQEWIFEWYKRLGYTPDVIDEEQNCVWLIKNI